jgi:hypothetical protein
MMKRIWLVYIGAVVALGLLVPVAGVASPGSGKTPIKVGPVAIVGVDDIGTCNNVWAQDSFNKFYTLTPNKDGTYNLQVNYKDGTFVTNAGQSPGACESGADNGNTVTAGVTGRTHQEYNATVTAPGIPNSNPDCAANNGCTGSGDFLNAVFGAGNWTRTGFGWTGHYEAGSNGTWFDTDVNWPLNDRGDITG